VVTCSTCALLNDPMQLAPSRTRFTPAEGYRISVGMWRSVPRVKAARLRLGDQFFERLMLAVTEVNGCSVCSWGHAKASLEAGLSAAEIHELLGGDSSGVPEAEGPAVLFAQHYAESRGEPSESAAQRLVTEYGVERAADITAAVRMIMWGNAYGIPLSGLLARLRGEPFPGSTALYEVGMLLSAPWVLLAAATASALGRP